MLLADITRCTGEGCPNRDACLRFTAQAPSGHRNVSMMGPPAQAIEGKPCPYFLPGICYGDSCYMTPERAALAELWKCDNCGFVACRGELPLAKDLSERIEPLGKFTDRECPKCGALCYPTESKESDAQNS